MATDYTTVGLLAEIRRRGRLPTAASDFTDANLLLEADTQLRELFVPLVMKTRGDFYMRYEDQTLVANQQAYPIPYRAMTASVRQVIWIDTSGREMELTPVPVTDATYFSAQSGTPYQYGLRDDELIVLPAPNAALGTLRIWYEYRPSKLVSSGFFTVSSVSSPNVVLTGSVTWTAASRYDFVRSKSPFSLLGIDADPTGTGTSTTVPFSTTLPTRLAAGDYMCLPDESPVPQLPAELHSVLALAVAAEALAQFDPDGSLLRFSQLEQRLNDWQGAIIPRTRGKQVKQVNRNSAIRRGGSSRRSTNLEP